MSDIMPAEFTLRHAHAGDREAIVRLAQLDSQPAPRGALVVAEAEGRIVAALALEAGGAIADPFVRTAELLELLRLRAAQLSGESNARRGGLRRRVIRAFRPATASASREM
jgi:hypothetical protein